MPKKQPTATPPLERLIVEQQTARQQYLSLKAQHSDCLLLLRQGDCYETFDEDAKVVADICTVTLTSRQVNEDVKIPLACVPASVIENAVTKLVNAGHRVAIAEPVTQVACRQ